MAAIPPPSEGADVVPRRREGNTDVLEQPPNEPAERDAILHAAVPRRVHGSVRLGEIAANSIGVPFFNLRPALDDLPEEQALAIEVNGRPVASLLCPSTGAAELALGWSFAHGFFDDFAQVRRLTRYPERIALMIEDVGAGGTAWARLVASGFDAEAHLRPPTQPPT